MDLNLLVAFEALYSERNVTRAGRRLGLSQPATSAALGRLRALFGDPLFVKTARGIEPTERCEALAPPIARALAQLRESLGDVEFDPATAERTFNVGAVDAVMAVVMPRLAAEVIRTAPRATLALRAINPGTAVALLQAREIDLAVCPLDPVPAAFSSRDLFEVPLTLAARPGHPLMKRDRRGARAPSMAQVAAYPHAMVVFSGPARTPLDEAFEAAGIARRAAVVLESFLAVPYVLAESDAVAFLPLPYARKLEAEGRLACLPLPASIALPPLRMRLVWPRRLDDSRAWGWLRDRLAALAPPG